MGVERRFANGRGTGQIPLPDFMSEIPKSYEPQAIEERWYAEWLASGCFQADPASSKPGYSIVIPPPNVTGVLTLGHVLNNTIQDVLARRARMLGKEVLWLPGTDHAGIATQTVVERTLKKQGAIRHRDDLGREGFLEKVWEWKEKHGGIIIQQLKKLGCSCDWSRERFTMDADYTKCVQRVFVDLYKKGLIYRGKRMVNWCPASLTALSDEEVVMKPQNGTMYHFKVEVVGQPGTWLTIATTRPETIPGDTAVAVNPHDVRYAHLIGQKVIRPLPLEVSEAERVMPIIGDEEVDFEFGTGVLKVTPAHDKVDFAIGQRHGLAVVDIINPDGVMNRLAGESLMGLDRFEARKVAVEELRQLGLLVKEDPYQNSLGYSERADVPIESRLSEQWFLKYPSVEEARACVAQSFDGGQSDVGHATDSAGEVYPEGASGNARELTGAKMRFFPERWAKVYDHWLGGIQDWCISRQLWWGHRVPVWSKRVSLTATNWEGEWLSWSSTMKSLGGGEGSVRLIRLSDGQAFNLQADEILAFDALGEGEYEVFVCTDEESLGKELDGAGFVQDADVLDTWFSSWLWPFATMGWPEKTGTLAKFYPTTDLVTGPDIIFFWVARMIMAGFEWMGEMPFRNVYFTGIIRDKQGRKMSKSLGNSPDPLDLIGAFGADALRFGVMRSAPLGADILFDEKNVELGRNFCTKLWNAARYRQMHGGTTEGEINPVLLTSDDQWILFRLNAAIGEVSAALDEYRFSDAANGLYRFFWSEYCDWYVEATKASLYANLPAGEAEASVVSGDFEERKANTLAVMDFVFAHTLRLMHPFLPFITEELWHALGFNEDLPANQGGKTIMLAHWPLVFDEDFCLNYGLDAKVGKAAEEKYEVVNLGRGLRRDANIASNKRVGFILQTSASFQRHDVEVLRILLNAEPLEVVGDYQPARGTPTTVTPLGTLFLPLEGLVDLVAERERLEKEMIKVNEEVTKVRAKLGNPNFADKVPASVLAEHQQRAENWAEKLRQLAGLLAALDG